MASCDHLLDQHRDKSIGTSLLKAQISSREKPAEPSSIHVERFNPALRLYEGLRFRQKEDKGVYLLMQWMPETGR